MAHEPANFEFLDEDGAVICTVPGEPHGAGLRVKIDPVTGSAAWSVRLRDAAGEILAEASLQTKVSP